MPTDIKSVLADEKFQGLAPTDQQQVLAKIDPKFASLSAADQAQVINHISNTVLIGGVPVNLKTGAGASTAANSQTQQASSAAVHPVSKSAGILQSGPTYVPDSNDTSATIAPSGSTVGIPGNLSGKIRTQSLNQVDQNAKQGIVAAGLSLAPELIPEVGGAGVGGTLLNAGIRGGNAAISGAGATVAGQALTGENPLTVDAAKEDATNAAIGATLGAGSKVLEEIPGAVKGTVGAVKENFLEPAKPTVPPELPTPVSTPVQVDTALSDAQLRKLGAKDLTPGGRETLRNAAGPVIQAGSSPELHLIRAIPEINSNIAADGTKLDGILKNAPPLPEAPATKVNAALENLRDNLPGGQEETLGKAIDKEATRYADALKSTDPQTLNQTIRDLDERISDYSAPENQLEGPASVRDAALVTIRRELRSTLNDAIPESKSVNASLADSLDARAFLRRKYGTLASDSNAATSQYQQQLQQGQAQLQRDQSMQLANDAYAERLKTVKRNQGVAKAVGAVAGGAGLIEGGKAVAGKLIK